VNREIKEQGYFQDLKKKEKGKDKRGSKKRLRGGGKASGVKKTDNQLRGE